MTRFFTYLAAGMIGELPLRTVQDAWHHTIVTNAVNDIVDGNAKMRAWAHEGRQDQTVIHEFMTKRSVGRIRGTHVYTDSEEILLEIARDRGIETRFLEWMRHPGYVPESLFYAVLGWPERILLKDPLVKGAKDTMKQGRQK
jgi:hypothetical protein